MATPVPPHGICTIPTMHISSTKLTISTSVLILHNHPSGDPVPSPEDMELTRRLAAAIPMIAVSQ